MTKRPVRRPDTDPATAAEARSSGPASRVEAWIAAAIKKEASRQGQGGESPAGTGERSPAPSPHGREAPAPATANRSEAQPARPATTSLDETVGILEDRLREMERETSARSARHDTIQASPDPQPATDGSAASIDPAADFEGSLRGFERRLGALTARVAAKPQPPAGGQPSRTDGLQEAVAQIRSRQARLDAAPARAEERPSYAARGQLARSETAILTSLKDEVAKLANRMEQAPPVPPAISSEIDTLRSAVAGLPTQDDMSRLEREIRSLTDSIAELRVSGQTAARSGDLEALQAEIRRLADPGMVETLGRQVEDVRHLLVNAAAPQAVALVETHLDDIRRELAAVGDRQVDPRDFAGLKAAVDDIRTSVAGPDRRSSSGQDLARVVRDIGQPIETMLTAVVDRLDRVERRIADPEALDQLERQITLLATRMGRGPGDDPALVSLERSMSDLLAQVSSWRDGAVEAAEHAARSAVAGSIAGLPAATGAIERHLAGLLAHYDAAEARTSESLASVTTTLDDVVRRLASIETGPTASRIPAGPDHERTRQAPPERRDSERALPPDLAAPLALPVADPPAEADEPLPPAASMPADEVLLEPGSARPRPPAGGPPGLPSSGGGETADIKANFIAAARRAAQAASADAAGTRARSERAPKTGIASPLSPTELVRRVRRLFEERRRPLLLSAAALVLAIGSLRVFQTAMAPDPSATPASRVAPQAEAARRPAGPAAIPAPMTVAALTPAVGRDLPDPTTTQAVVPREGARAPSPPAPAPSAAIPAVDPREVASAAPAAAPAPAAAAPEKEAAKMSAVPVSPALLGMALPGAPRAEAQQAAAAAPLPAGLRQAAQAGNPVALFELALRTAEGRGVPRDPKAAAGLFEKAADKNLAPAQYRVGNLYEKGIGVGRDLEAAKSWYKRAAENGNVRAMHNLAVLIAEGGGAKPDYAAALFWFNKAAGYGIRDSQFNLAVLHARGLGTAQDLSKAYLWLAIAAAQGDEDAGRKRDEVGARLSAPDLARVKGEVERWRATPTNPAANEVQPPASGWPEPAVKRAGRGTRV